MVTNLPAGAARYSWHGNDYWHAGYGWYRPYWAGDSMYYGWVYPPTGYYYTTLPDGYNTVAVGGSTYYESDGVYYQPGEQDGQQGYVVAEPPVTQEVAAADEGSQGGETGEGQNAFVLLKGMCDYVAGLDKFSLVANTTTDNVTADGDKVQLAARRTMQVDRPNKFAVDVNGDNGAKRFVYDGKSITMFDGAANAYSTVPMPDTIDAALDTLARDYGAAVPLEDLMYKDLFARLESIATTGQYLGLTDLDGVKCHHLAFSASNADCEIWIDAGDKPLLRKMTIDYKQNAPRTRYSAAIVQWNASPTFTPETFTFTPPGDAKQMQIAPRPNAG